MSFLRILSTALALTILFTNFDHTSAQLVQANIIRVLNKGWFLANVQCYYDITGSQFEYPNQFRAVLGLNEQSTFIIPITVSPASLVGIILSADAVVGVQIMNIRVPAFPLCIHIWGTTLFPAWTYMDCSQF